MRMELFKCEITRSDRLAIGFLVAPDQQRASEIVIASEIELNQENLGFTLERVDEALPAEQRLGLDTLLDCAPVGFILFCPGVGWIPHALPAPRLHLDRIEEASGDEHFVGRSYRGCCRRGVLRMCRVEQGRSATVPHPRWCDWFEERRVARVAGAAGVWAGEHGQLARRTRLVAGSSGPSSNDSRIAPRALIPPAAPG